MAYKWPTDGPLGVPRHSVSWKDHLDHLRGQGVSSVPNFNGGTVDITLPPPGPPPVDPRIDAWYQGQLGTLGQGRSDALDHAKTNVGTSAIDTGFKFGTSGHTAKDAQSNDYTYDTYSFDPNQYESANANGVLTADIDKASVDPDNPFSKMSMLQQAYEGAKRGTTNSYGAAGHLYSSAIGHKRTSDHTNASGVFDSLLKAFQQVISGANSDVTTAIGNYNTGASTTAGQRLNFQTNGFTG